MEPLLAASSLACFLDGEEGRKNWREGDREEMMATRKKNISNSEQTTDIKDIRNDWVISDSGSSSSKWGSKEIPQDIMESILRRLPISDYLRCKAVCLSWREAVDSAISTKQCPPVPPQPYPCLFSHHYRCFYDRNDKYVGWIEGWLIKADWSGSIFTLLNPVSGGVVKLPRYYQDPATPFICKVVASSVPFTTPHYQCIVACLSSDNAPRRKDQIDAKKGGSTSLAICRPIDKKWTRIHHQRLLSSHFEDIEFIDRKLYAATKNPSEFLMVFHFDVDVDDDILRYRMEKLVSVEAGPEHDRFERMFKVRKSGVFLFRDYPTSKELFMFTFPDNLEVERHVVHNLGDVFQVFKLDDDARNNGIGGGSRSRWVEMVHISDWIQKIPQFSSVYFAGRIDACQLQIYLIIHHCLAMSRYRLLVYLTPNPW